MLIEIFVLSVNEKLFSFKFMLLVELHLQSIMEMS